MATALLHWTEPASLTSVQSERMRRIDAARGQMLVEFAHVPAARRTLLALADAIQNQAAPASALIEGAGDAAREAACVNRTLSALARVRQLDRRMAVLRVRASGPCSAAQAVACRRESACLSEAAATILRELPISRAFVRAVATQLLSLEEQLEHASRRLTGPADIDRIHVVERRVGLCAESFRERCAKIRHAGTRLTAGERPHVAITRDRPAPIGGLTCSACC